MSTISIARVRNTWFPSSHTALGLRGHQTSHCLNWRRISLKSEVFFVSRRRLCPSSVVLAPFVRCSLSATSPPQDSSNDTSGKSNGEDLGNNTKRVIVSTTRNSRTARAITNEPESISERYVQGSLKFEIGISQSFSLENETANMIDVDEGPKFEPLSQHSSETGEATTTAHGEGGPLWSSESYLRQALKARYLTQTVKTRQRYKEVVLRFPTTNGPLVHEFPSKNEDIQEKDGITDRSELQSGSAESNGQLLHEDELYLRRALNAKRQLAAEILETALRAGELGLTFTETLISSMPQFIDRIVTEAVGLKKHPKYKEHSFNSRARLYISNAKVVELVKWLKHLKLTAPRIGRLICTADESIGLIKSRVKWLRTIYIRGRDLGIIIERYPQILGLSLEDLNKNVEILETAGVQRKWMGLVVSRQPRILTLGADELVEKISMITELGLSKEQFGVMVFKFPAIAGHFTVEEMQSKVGLDLVNLLQRVFMRRLTDHTRRSLLGFQKVHYLKEIGIDDAVLVKVLASTPQLLACNIEESWAKLLRYFYFLRVELSGIRRIIGVNPSVFCLNLEENIAPKVKFLRAIGVHEEAIGQLIVEFPAILTYSLEKKIRPVTRFLLEEAGVTEDKVGKVITMQPELIRCSLPNKLMVLVKYLRSKGFKSREIGGMIEDFPALLMYNVPALHPKFQYLTRVMKRPLADAVTFPRYFSYSLQSRIIPRHELLNNKGLTFSLRHMLACSDDLFNSRVVVAEQIDPTTSKESDDPVLSEDQQCTPVNEQSRSMEADS